MSDFSSSIADLNNAVKSQNPFDRPLVVRSQDVWGKGFPDVPSLNAHASNAVFEAIEKVHTKQRQVIGITITAEKGLGKSHLISRIRHSLQTDGRALFIYMSECGDLNRIKTEFLRTLASSLKQIGSQGVSQWQELATALVNEAYNNRFTRDQLFPEEHSKDLKIVEYLRDKVLLIKPDIENPDIITAIMWTLSLDTSYQLYALNWLSGRNLPKSKADALGLPNSNTQEDKEAESFNTVRQLLDLISDYKPIVVCFDELDVAECSESGFTKAQVTVSLAKDLYNSIKRGVLLTAIYPDTWIQQIKILPQSEAVIARIGEKVLDLKYLNSDDVVALVSQWLKDFYDEKGLTPPHPVYPFDESKLRELGREKPPVRQILNWCAENFKVPIDATPALDANTELEPITATKHPVESAYNNELAALESTVEDYMEDKATLVNALQLGFSTLIGQTVEQVQIEEITKIKVKSVDKDYLDFKVVGNENGKIVKIGVAVLQESGGKIIKATLRRLIDYQRFDFTRGCLVRSKKINPNAAMAQQYLSQLLSPELGGEWALLKREDIKPLLAILRVQKACEDYELSKDEIVDFIVQQRIAIDNYLIREILSDPSGQIPKDAIDEDSENANVNLPDKADMGDVEVEALANE